MTGDLIGRSADAAALTVLIEDPAIRLITVTGPPGVGKSALVRAVCAERDVVLVQCAGCPDLAVVLNAAEAAPPDRPSLVVLDGFDFGDAREETVLRLLRQRSECCVIVTTRRAMRVPDEHRLALAPLPLPHAGAELEDPRSTAAIALYVDRASAVRADLDTSAEGLASIRSVCELTDGLPLAIELAARWADILPPAAFLAQVSASSPADALSLFREPASAQTPTGASLAGALDRSYELLTADQQALLARLSVFEGSADVAAVAEVCLPPQSDHVLAVLAAGNGTVATLDLLAGLSDQSLLVPVDQSAGTARIALLRTVRSYARCRLIEQHSEAVLLARHAAYFLRWVRRVTRDLNTATHGRALSDIDRERPNLLAAIRWSCAHEPGCATALGILAAIWQYWYFAGDLDEAMEHVELVLSSVGDQPDAVPAAYYDVLLAAGVLAHQRGESRVALNYLSRILHGATGASDPGRRAVAVTQLAMIARDEGARDAREILAANITSLRAAGNDDALAFALAVHAGELVGDGTGDRRARNQLTESVDIFARRQNHWGMAFALRALAGIAYRGREFDTARQLLDRAIELFGQDRALRSLVDALDLLGTVASAQGDTAAVEHATSERVAACRELGAADRWQLPTTPKHPAFATPDEITAALREAVRVAERQSPVTAQIAGSGITAREIDVLRLLSQARTNAEIADELGIGVETVRRHVSNLLMKIGARNRVEAALYAVRNGL